MAGKTANSGSFSSTNQPKNRKGRGKDKRTLFREGLEAQGKTEADLLAIIANRVYDSLKAGQDVDPHLLKVYFDSFPATSKTTFIEIEGYSKDLEPEAVMLLIEAQMASGVLAIEEAALAASVVRMRNGIEEESIKLIGSRIRKESLHKQIQRNKEREKP